MSQRPRDIGRKY